MQRVEAAQHQARAEQQEDRQRHLRRGERAAQPLAPQPGRGVRGAVAQRLGQVQAQRLRPPARSRRETSSGSRAPRRRAACAARCRAARAPAAPPAPCAAIMRTPTHAKTSPSSAARDREDEALGQELPRQPRLAGADRGAHRDLALPALGPREQQVGDVGAGHQQQEEDGAEDEDERAPRAAADLLLDRNREGLEAHLRPDRRPGASGSPRASSAPRSRARPSRPRDERRRRVVAVVAVGDLLRVDLQRGSRPATARPRRR